eukprot:5825250-Alexandrium_andersonii.AAC.1
MAMSVVRHGGSGLHNCAVLAQLNARMSVPTTCGSLRTLAQSATLGSFGGQLRGCSWARAVPGSIA